MGLGEKSKTGSEFLNSEVILVLMERAFGEFVETSSNVV